MAASTDLVTAAEVKTYLGISGSDHDTLIDELIDIVSEEVENYCGTYFSSTAVTDNIDGGTEYLLTSKAPIISITSITDTVDSTTVTATDYGSYDDAGMIYLDQDVTIYPHETGKWNIGRERFTVVYNAGYATIPEAIKLVAYSWIERHLKTIPSSNTKGRWTQPNIQHTQTEEEFVKLLSLGFTAEEQRILNRYRVQRV